MSNTVLYEMVALVVDKPNQNDRLYPKSVVEKALLKFQEDILQKDRGYVMFNNDPSHFPRYLIQDIVGGVKEVRICTNNDLVVKFELLKTPLAKLITDANNGVLDVNSFKLSAVGIGTLVDAVGPDGKEVNVVSDDYTLDGFILERKVKDELAVF